MAEVLGRLPRNANPSLLVGFESSDDAGVFLLPSGQALVQTMDFFTPIVDDPYSYGQIAAANALSDVYAMGGTPLSVLNIACFDPNAAPADTWAAVLQGMYDKTVEAGAVVLGGHTVEDDEPKFGLAVTGIVDPERVWRNDSARHGDQIWLSKPLGVGIVTTAAMNDRCSDEELRSAVDSMSMLNDTTREKGLALTADDGSPEVVCATDITGFGLAGHLFNIARASQVRIEIQTGLLPLLPGLERMVAEGCVTGGALKNRLFLGERLVIGESVPPWIQEVAVDPQTSGGLAILSREPVEGCVKIGRVVEGGPSIVLL